MPKNAHLKLSGEEKATIERDALAVLRAIARNTKASPATRAQAARAMLEAIRPSSRPEPRQRTKPPAPTRTPEELRAALVAVRSKANITR